MSTYILNASFESQIQKPYNLIKSNKTIKKIKILHELSNKSNLEEVSNLFEIGLYAQSYSTKKKFFERLNFFLISDVGFCEDFFTQKNLLSHNLIKKINLSPQSEETMYIITTSIKKGYESKEVVLKKITKDKLSRKGLATITFLKDGENFDSLDKVGKCKLLTFYLSQIQDLNTFTSEKLLLNGTISYFLNNTNHSI